jgi:hypothetical protein
MYSVFKKVHTFAHKPESQSGALLMRKWGMQSLPIFASVSETEPEVGGVVSDHVRFAAK